MSCLRLFPVFDSKPEVNLHSSFLVIHPEELCYRIRSYFLGLPVVPAKEVNIPTITE